MYEAFASEQEMRARQRGFQETESSFESFWGGIDVGLRVVLGTVAVEFEINRAVLAGRSRPDFDRS